MASNNMTIKEASKALNVSKREVYKYIQNGELSCLKKGKKSYVLSVEVQSLKKKLMRQNKLSKWFSPGKKIVIFILVCIFVYFGMGQLLGHDLYMQYLHKKIYPPIVVSPNPLEFDRTTKVLKQVFYVKNRSGEPHTSIEVLVYVDDLDNKLEDINLSPIRKTEKTDKSFKKKDIENSILQQDMVFEGDYTMSFKDGRPFKYARIAKLEPGEAKPIAVTFRSIRTGTTMPNPRTLKLPVKINSYDKLPGLTIMGKDTELPYKTIKIQHFLGFKFRKMNITAIIDDRKKAWLLADEVCSVLKIKNVNQSLEKLNFHQKSIVKVNYSDGKTSKKLIISESGFLQLVKISKDSVANAFQEWVTNIVFPQIKENKK